MSECGHVLVSTVPSEARREDCIPGVIAKGSSELPLSVLELMLGSVEEQQLF